MLITSGLRKNYLGVETAALGSSKDLEDYPGLLLLILPSSDPCRTCCNMPSDPPSRKTHHIGTVWKDARRLVPYS